MQKILGSAAQWAQGRRGYPSHLSESAIRVIGAPFPLARSPRLLFPAPVLLTPASFVFCKKRNRDGKRLAGEVGAGSPDLTSFPGPVLG